MLDVYSRLTQTYNNYIMINLVKRHITNLDQLQDLRCTVCFEFEPFLMRCKGPCKGPLCLRCATAICKTTLDAKCPQRCSDSLQLEPCPNFKLELSCPSQKQWKAVFGGVVTFTNHIMKCHADSISKPQHAMRNYLCNKGHLLYFLDQDIIAYALQRTYFQPNQPCFQCKQSHECRSLCLQCSTEGGTKVYCHDCMPIPCTKKSCPVGHNFIKVQVEGNISECDLCGFLIHLSSKLCYFDFKCFFYICEHCYKGIPEEEHPLVPLVSNLALKAKLNMSFHDLIMKKLMSKHNHQQAVYRLALAATGLVESLAYDSESELQGLGLYDEPNQLQDQDEVFQSDYSEEGYSYEQHSAIGSVYEGNHSSHSNNLSSLSYDIPPIADNYQSESMSFSELDYNEDVPIHRVIQQLDSYLSGQELLEGDRDDSFLFQGIDQSGQQDQDEELNDDY